MQKMKLVMVGNGMAGVRTIEELLKIAPDLYDITVFGAEPHANYNRIMLSPVLAGEQTLKDIMLNDVDWYERNGITLHLNRKIVKIDRTHRTIEAEDGTVESYDRLLLATGSNPVMLPVPGRELPGVVSFRDIRDVDAMLAASSSYRHAVVIGGGLLGLEAANGLMQRGMDVTVVHLAPWLMERQLDETAARMLQRSLEAKGLKFKLSTQTSEISNLPPLQGEGRGGDGVDTEVKGLTHPHPSLPPEREGAKQCGRVAAVRFKDGSEIPADLVVMAVGIRPNSALAESAGIHCERGIVVNDTMQTYDPRIYAIGECVAHRGVSYGLVAPLFEMSKVCANHLALMGIGRYTGSTVSTKLKVTGIDLFSAGNFSGGEGTEEIVMSDAAGGVYKKLVLRDNKLEGAVLYGNTTDGAWYFQLLREKRCLGDIRQHLLTGQPNLGTGGHQGQTHAAAMPEDMEVCGCNGITKGMIVTAIKAKGLFTIEDVRKHTKASGSCGSCTGLVEQILASTLGGDYSATPAAKPMCGCTEHTHEEVRAAIREHKLLTIPDAMKFMDWRTPNGCAGCRPALNYYLISTWPHEAQDDPQSRLINERAHANIQKDGTFSVVPRMWGGVTNPAELRRIADVADKYAVPMIRVTGGQRIDLFGVKKEDLPSIWADLDMPSGHAYGKALRTVKTCVGSEFCRFGTQDSTGMGIALEKAFWNVWTPHKFKLAVSGCPRNCAEAAIKDVGVIGVDSGWEIHVAGNGGIKTEVAQFLVKVKTAEEVLEYTGAFLQLYREEARYLDRTVHWVQRVGLEYVKSKVLDEGCRKALYRRLLFALQGNKDPWAARAVEGVEKHEFEALTV
ncbi:MAG: nitrite reductase large subunit NirB [Sulfuricella sp.]|nr:nitrite reductase large subunit NirB [Sulfuricella sp.]